MSYTSEPSPIKSRIFFLKYKNFLITLVFTNKYELIESWLLYLKKYCLLLNLPCHFYEASFPQEKAQEKNLKISKVRKINGGIHIIRHLLDSLEKRIAQFLIFNHKI